MGGEVLERYDAFLLDQFGVLHDGKRTYEGSAECVRWLQEQGKRICVLSNSSKRRQESVERLQALQCGMCTYLDVADVVKGVPAISAFTSGELVFQALKALNGGGASPLLALPSAERAFVFGNGDDDDEYLKAAGVTSVASVDDADFLLARGLFQIVGDSSLTFQNGDECDLYLRRAAERGLLMVVANPDLVRPDGNDSPMPGQLALRYESLFGGSCVRVGKPHAAIYAEALAALESVGVPKDRVAAVGDSVHHDVLGANDAGLDSIFVAGGIHARDLGVAQGLHQTPDDALLDAFFHEQHTRAGVQPPTFVVPGFTL